MPRIAVAVVAAILAVAPVRADDDELLPWQPGQLAQMLIRKDPKGAEGERIRANAAAFHASVSARWAELSRKYRTALVEDLIVEPEAYQGSTVAVLSKPSFVNMAREKPTFTWRTDRPVRT